jgi:hypothetical protein
MALNRSPGDMVYINMDIPMFHAKYLSSSLYNFRDDFYTC